jgi:hypothetical protein
MAKTAAVSDPIEDTNDVESLKEIARSMRDLVAAQEGQRQKTITEITPDTPWNNPRNPRKTKLKGDVIMNGVKCNPEFISEQEAALFNQLKSGLYNHKKWTVRRNRDGAVSIKYPNKTFEQRMEMKNTARNLVEMLQHIVMEQETQAAKRKAGTFDEDEY